MTPIFERAFPASRLATGATGCYAISVSWLFAGLLTAAFIEQTWRLASSARANEDGDSISSRFNAAHSVRAEPSLGTSANFVSVLPALVNPDATIRFTSRIAQDQDVRISQMQSQSIATDAKKLGQAKFTLQLRGDYPHIKNVVIGLLAKFPGLTLQRLTLHHRDAAAGNPADKGNDEATLELIQFLRPAAMS